MPGQSGSRTITQPLTSADVLAPLHPGEVRREELVLPRGMSAGDVAKACHVPRTRIERIVREETDAPADTALRMGRLFGTPAQLWLNLQSRHDIELAQQAIAAILDKTEPVAA